MLASFAKHNRFSTSSTYFPLNKCLGCVPADSSFVSIRRGNSVLVAPCVQIGNQTLIISNIRQNGSFKSAPSISSGKPVRQYVRNKVFVSSHNDMNISAQQILDYCKNRKISVKDARVNASHVILKECPFCSKPTNNSTDNMFKLYIQLGGGAYFCHRCGAGGSWFDFKSTLRGYEVVSAGGEGQHVSFDHQHLTAPNHPRKSDSSVSKGSKNIPSLPLPKQRLQAVYNSSLIGEAPNKALSYLEERGFKATTLRKYGVGRAFYQFPNNDGQYVSAECITFPWLMSVADVIEQEELRGSTFVGPSPDSDEKSFITRRIKVRAVDEKGWQRLDPAGGGWGLFGFHTVPHDAKAIVLTEGEYDAMAVWQSTGRPAVSLPNGCRSLPMEVLPMLERFDKIYLWMDNDGPGQEGAQIFAQKIGMNRCFVIQPDPSDPNPPKDANEALQKGCDLEEMVQGAKLLSHEKVIRFGDLRTDVLHEIMHPDKYVGVPITSLPSLTKIIKGFRRGELTVLTGPTGSGKTTFLGQMSLDLAEQDIHVLWGSFEIKNTRLIQKLLQQHSREPLPVGQPSCVAHLNRIADHFAELPLSFMKFHGGSDIDDVLDAMEYAVYVNDVEHIILDNMQFMISRRTLEGSFDKFDVQDTAIERFRQFATDRNVHVSLVVHPRKEDESAKLTMSSVYGSAKATQEADTVMILQNDGRRKYLEVKKNRFDGTLGFCPLHFDRLSGRYNDTP